METLVTHPDWQHQGAATPGSSASSPPLLPSECASAAPGRSSLERHLSLVWIVRMAVIITAITHPMWAGTVALVTVQTLPTPPDWRAPQWRLGVRSRRLALATST
jgi:hypothetical protein